MDLALPPVPPCRPCPRPSGRGHPCGLGALAHPPALRVLLSRGSLSTLEGPPLRGIRGHLAPRDFQGARGALCGLVRAGLADPAALQSVPQDGLGGQKRRSLEVVPQCTRGRVCQASPRSPVRLAGQAIPEDPTALLVQTCRGGPACRGGRDPHPHLAHQAVLSPPGAQQCPVSRMPVHRRSPSPGPTTSHLEVPGVRGVLGARAFRRTQEYPEAQTVPWAQMVPRVLAVLGVR